MLVDFEPIAYAMLSASHERISLCPFRINKWWNYSNGFIKH